MAAAATSAEAGGRRRVYILPISHVASESRARVAWAVETLKPGFVAVELDPRRLFLLFNGEHLRGRRGGMWDWRRPRESIVALTLSLIQGFFGGKTGQTPGEEFLVAIRLAQKGNIPIVLIDRDVSITISRLSSAITAGTLLKFLKVALFGRRVERFDLNRVPSERIVRSLLRELKGEFPRIYAAVVSERDEFMAARLAELPEGKSVLVVAGAAHIPGLRRRIPSSTIL